MKFVDLDGNGGGPYTEEYAREKGAILDSRFRNNSDGAFSEEVQQHWESKGITQAPAHTATVKPVTYDHIPQLKMSKQIGEGIYEGLPGELVGFGILKAVDEVYDAYRTLRPVSESGDDLFAGVKASKFLQEQGVSRVYRKQIIESFETTTISLKTTDDATFGLRFFGGKAREVGSYLLPTFTNYTNRTGLALPPSFNNTMTGLRQFQLSSGTKYLYGRAASQGCIYVGGSAQIFINNTKSLIP